jgi:hypothetical protein
MLAFIDFNQIYKTLVKFYYVNALKVAILCILHNFSQMVSRREKKRAENKKYVSKRMALENIRDKRLGMRIGRR